MAVEQAISGNIRSLSGVRVDLLISETQVRVDSTHSNVKGEWRFNDPATNVYDILFSGRRTNANDNKLRFDYVSASDANEFEGVVEDVIVDDGGTGRVRSDATMLGKADSLGDTSDKSKDADTDLNVIVAGTRGSGDGIKAEVIRNNANNANLIDSSDQITTGLKTATGGVLSTNADDGKTGFDDTTQFRDGVIPSNIPVYASISSTIMDDGSAEVIITWTYTQGANKAHGFMVRWEQGKGTTSPATVASNGRKLDSTVRTFKLTIPSNNFISFGVSAYYTAKNETVETAITSHVDWTDHQPATSVSVVADIKGDLLASDDTVLVNASTKKVTPDLLADDGVSVSNKVKGLTDSGDYGGMGTGNQRIFIDYVNGKLVFYRADNTIIVEFGDNITGGLDGISFPTTDVALLWIASALGLAGSDIHTEHVENIAGTETFLKWVSSTNTTPLYDEGIKLGSTESYIALTKLFLDTAGSYMMNGADIIDSNGYQVGVLKTRSFHNLGYDPAISVTGVVATTTLEAKTVDGATNGQGFRMIRAGKVTGISIQIDVTDPASVGTIDPIAEIILVHNGAQQSSEKASINPVNLVSAGDAGAQNDSMSYAFAAGDRIGADIKITNSDTVGTFAIDDISIIIEVST